MPEKSGSLQGRGQGQTMPAQLRQPGALMLDERRIREHAADEIERLVGTIGRAKLCIHGIVGGEGVDAAGMLGEIEEILDWYGHEPDPEGWRS
jgi:hypothetical protein